MTMSMYDYDNAYGLQLCLTKTMFTQLNEYDITMSTAMPDYDYEYDYV
jgi:hypothetical protein